MELAASAGNKFPIIGGAPTDAIRQLVYSLSKYLISFYFMSVMGYWG